MALISMHNVYIALIASCASYIGYYIYWQLTVGARRRRMIKEHGCQPAISLRGWDVFFGLALAFMQYKNIRKRRLLEGTRQRFAQLGNTFHMNILGVNLYMTIEPENLKSVMALQFKNFGLGSRRIKEFTPLLGEGIFTTDGAKWQHSRDMLRPNFVRSQVGDLNMFEGHVNQLIQALPRDGSTVNLAEYFFKLTMDSATEFLFGESTNSLTPGTTSESGRKFEEAFNRAQEAVGTRARSRFALFAFFLPDAQKIRDTKTVHDFVDAFVERGFAHKKSGDMEKGNGRYIFLNELLKQTDSKYKVRSELLNILLAGRDTTASLLSNVWWEISKRPDIWAKLRDEVDDLGGEKPTYEQIKDMKYLRAVLNESLRLYPVVPGNSREAYQDCVLPTGGGPDGSSPVFIPKGTTVAWSVYSMHRRKDFYGEDADDFRPERWETLKPGWEYLPFNGGPRICIGQQYALTEASYTTVRLMQEFKDIESRDPEPWTESMTLTCTGLNGAKVGLTPA